jgi:hypothetical protein
VTQTLVWLKDTDPATGTTVYFTVGGYGAVPSPVVAGYQAQLAQVPATSATARTATQPRDETVTVSYSVNLPGQSENPPAQPVNPPVQPENPPAPAPVQPASPPAQSPMMTTGGTVGAPAGTLLPMVVCLTLAGIGWLVVRKRSMF